MIFFHGGEAGQPTKVTAVTDLGSVFKGVEIFVSLCQNTEDMVLTYSGSW